MSDLEPGFFPEFSGEDYHKKRLGVVSKSALDALHPTPAHYRAWVNGDKEKSSGALSFGKMGHLAIFQLDEFVNKYKAEPDFGDCRFKENKQKRLQWREENAGFEFISPREFSMLVGIEDSIQQHKLVRRLFADGQSEATLIWVDEVTGLTCKSKVDHYVERYETCVDLKLVEDASPKGFAKSVAKWRYHVQDALYREGFAALGKPLKFFIFVAAEKSPPFASAVYSLDAEAIASGYSTARTDIATMSRCIRQDHWPGYPAGIQTLSLPQWAA